MCDEHRADLTGFMGNQIIRTPNLDRLAKTGVVFDNAYTPAPICIPARQCMMAGQYAKTCKCEVFGDDLTPGYMTFARQFSRYAYHTTVCGKLHHCGLDQMQGWTQRIGMDANVSAAYIREKNEKAFAEFVRPTSKVKWSQAKEVKRAAPGAGHLRETDYYTIQGAIQYIDQYFNDAWYDREQTMTPLLLKISLLKPHYPYFAEGERFKYYLNRVIPYLEDVSFAHPALTIHRVKVGEDASEREIRRATAAYYAMIEEADDQFGQILDALERAGQNLDNWIVVYTSDHGEMLGQHGVWEKQKFYEGSVRVPLMIRWPKRFAPRRVYQNVNLCDIFATLCDLAGIPIPDGLESRSLTSLMRGENENWNNETVSQYNGEHLMIKWDALKYQYYGEDLPEMLFDLTRNPEETVDFINDPLYGEVVQKFRKRRKELGF